MEQSIELIKDRLQEIRHELVMREINQNTISEYLTDIKCEIEKIDSQENVKNTAGYAILCFNRKTLVSDLDEVLKTGFEFKSIISEHNDIIEILLINRNCS